MHSPSKKVLISLFGLLAVLAGLLCLCTAIWAGGGLVLLRLRAANPPGQQFYQTPVPDHGESAAVGNNRRPTPSQPVSPAKPGLKDLPNLSDIPLTSNPGLPTALENQQAIENSLVPASDLEQLAKKLRGIAVAPSMSGLSTSPIPLGARQNFWVMNADTDRNNQITAKLVYITDQTYFWVEDGLRYNQKSVQRLTDVFDKKIVPTNRQFFGSEWNPGIDGDPRLHILYARGLGNSIAGYFSSADEYPQQINQYSNTHEMFVFNADTTRLEADFTYGVLAHEFQHMIHWYKDRNEETWLNEGFADLAAFLNGYSTGGADQVYAQDTDIQLNDLPKADLAHYGAAFLYLTYFLDRFGEKATQAVVSNPANGLASIDQALANSSATDAVTGKPITADDVFIDWAITNYLQSYPPAQTSRVDDGRYTYKNYPQAPAATPTENIRNCPTALEPRQVHQYGVDYIRIRCPGDYLLRFEGAAQVPLLPAQAHSGATFFWSNFGDESDSTLTRAFDFSRVSGPLSLNYWTWFDIEKGYDHVYALASQDDGQTWQILPTPSGSLEDASGNSFGWAYTGISGNSSQPGWIQEQLDLSSLAGKKVLLRFEYVTDGAINKAGFLLDDISIPEIGYAEDFEPTAGSDAQGLRDPQGLWDAQGFVRVQNVLPQTFRLAMIETGGSFFNPKPIRVSKYQTQDGAPLEIQIHVGGSVNEIILVVAGTTRITRQLADYSLEIKTPPVP